MRMTIVFTVFAIVAAGAGQLMPNVVHRLGFWMAIIYLTLAVLAALLTLIRRPG